MRKISSLLKPNHFKRMVSSLKIHKKPTFVAFGSICTSLVLYNAFTNPIETVECKEQSKLINFNILGSEEYQFPTSKLKQGPKGTESVVLLACGSFNPPTILHLQLLEGAKDYFQNLEKKEVLLGILSPVHDGYGKKGLLPYAHRYNMVDICAEDSNWISVDNWEGKQEGYSTTVKVLRHVDEEVKKRQKNPQDVRVILVCGADLLESFNKPGLWDVSDQEEILSKFGVAVLERGNLNLNELIFGNDLMSKYQNNIYVLPELVKNDVSSTKIRQFIKRGYSIKYMVPRGIPDYVQKNHLYK